MKRDRRRLVSACWMQIGHVKDRNNRGAVARRARATRSEGSTGVRVYGESISGSQQVPTARSCRNSGVSLIGGSLANLLRPVPLGIAVGLFFGKQVGVFGFAWLAIKTGFGAAAGQGELGAALRRRTVMRHRLYHEPVHQFAGFWIKARWQVSVMAASGLFSDLWRPRSLVASCFAAGRTMYRSTQKLSLQHHSIRSLPRWISNYRTNWRW